MPVVEECPPIDVDLLARVYGEYCEMPGLQLTLAQAARLWNLERAQAAQILEALVDATFLRRVRDVYVRADSWRAYACA